MECDSHTLHTLHKEEAEPELIGQHQQVQEPGSGQVQEERLMRSQSLTGSRKMKTLLLVTVIVSIADGVVGGLHPGPSMPGSPSNISSSDRSLRRVALAAAHSFNDQSNDAFLFKPSAILGAQRQVVKGFRYFLDLNISRTVCHKRDEKKLQNCDFQPEGPLQQTFRCHTDVWLVPWKNQTETLLLLCKA
ncbi:cystatin-F [Amphiprion ocellaris]|uniref:cystatin-F n=1 Tax=Amphiprion ocellaris TaxID=80972 RepID=UPI0024110364|nr:cystatin-F [Amphiprion ocellaris]